MIFCILMLLLSYIPGQGKEKSPVPLADTEGTKPLICSAVPPKFHTAAVLSGRGTSDACNGAKTRPTLLGRSRAVGMGRSEVNFHDALFGGFFSR